MLIRHQPSRAVSTRVSRFRAFSGVQTVRRESRGKLSRNEIGKVAAPPASAQQNSLTRRLDRAQISHTKRSPKTKLCSTLGEMPLREQISTADSVGHRRPVT